MISRDSELFKKQEVKLKAEQYRRYMKLLSQNRLLMDLYLVKTNLDQAYLRPTAAEMKLYIEEIINYCNTVKAQKTSTSYGLPDYLKIILTAS